MKNKINTVKEHLFNQTHLNLYSEELRSYINKY